MDQTIVAMCLAGVTMLFVGALAARRDVARARGLDRIVALGNLCYAIPLAVFGALHLFGTRFVIDLVPEFMPWHLFWAYFVGVALIAASVSIAINVAVRWSGLFVGILMYLFVAMIHLPGALAEPHDRIIWTIVLREMSFGGAGWILAGSAVNGWPGKPGKMLVLAGRVFVTMALLLFGFEHFLHPMGLPGVPLEKEIPSWVPLREVVDYITGAALLVCAGSVILKWKTRTVAACVGGWIVLMVIVMYGPVLVLALVAPETGTQLEGVNYFADTLLFGGTVIALAKGSPAPGGARTGVSM